jgi:hypothetical protein
MPASHQSPAPGFGKKNWNLSGFPSQSLESDGGGFFIVMLGQTFANSAFSRNHFSSPGSVSGLIASTWVAGRRARDRAARETDGQVRAHGRHPFAQRLRLRSRGQLLCLPWRQRAEEISSLVLEATRRSDQRSHDDLLRAQARLRILCAQAQVLPERSCTQDRALRS